MTLVGLLVATAAAFAVTERLKLVKSPITGTRISKVFSPTCACTRRKANISVKFRRRDVVNVSILDAERRQVQTLIVGDAVPRGRNIFHWDGLTDLGNRAPQGTYQVQIHLDQQRRTILLPNRIRLDTTAPEVNDAHPNRTQFSPDGDHRADTVSIEYVLSKPAHAVVYYQGRRIIRSHSSKTHGAVVWAGRIDGQVLPRGVVTLTVGAVDDAGNVTPVTKRTRVRIEIRYITLASHRITGVSVGGPIAIGVSTDAARYAWRLGRRRGFASGPFLQLTAPQRKGLYRLTVTANGQSDHAAVIVK